MGGSDAYFLDYIDEDTIQVVEMFLLNNPTNLLMTADQPGNPVVEYHLPAGASNLVFDSGELGGRYTSLETGLAIRRPFRQALVTR